MRLTLCTLFNMNYHFVNTYYYCVHFSNYIVLFLSLLHTNAHVHIRSARNERARVYARSRRRAGAHVGPHAQHTHTHSEECLCDGCILMRSNKDGNDPVHFTHSQSLLLPLFPCVSCPLPGTQLLVYIKPMRRVHLKKKNWGGGVQLNACRCLLQILHNSKSP